MNAQRLSVSSVIAFANASVHGAAGALLTVMPLGSQIVSRLGVMYAVSGFAKKATPSIASALSRLGLARSTPIPPARTDVAVCLCTGVGVTGVGVTPAGGRGQPLSGPATDGQRSAAPTNPSPSPSGGGQPRPSGSRLGWLGQASKRSAIPSPSASVSPASNGQPWCSAVPGAPQHESASSPTPSLSWSVGQP